MSAYTIRKTKKRHKRMNGNKINNRKNKGGNGDKEEHKQKLSKILRSSSNVLNPDGDIDATWKTVNTPLNTPITEETFESEGSFPSTPSSSGTLENKSKQKIGESIDNNVFSMST